MKKRLHLTLVGPKGKQAGLNNQGRMARQLHCISLTSSGIGGGITTLLLPETIHEKQNLEKLVRRGYTVKKVPIRLHGRQVVRDAVSDQLLVMMSEKFISEKPLSPRVRAALIREFTDWICHNLKDHRPNDIRSIVAQAHPDLVDRTSPDWWRKRIAQRKK